MGENDGGGDLVLLGAVEIMGLLPAASATLNGEDIWWSWEWGLVFRIFDVLPNLEDIEGLEEHKYKIGSTNAFSVSLAIVAEHGTHTPKLNPYFSKHQH